MNETAFHGKECTNGKGNRAIATTINMFRIIFISGAQL